MAATIAALDLLAEKTPLPRAEVCVLFGDEPLLRSEVLARLRASLLNAEDAEFSLVRLDGASIEWRTLMDELSTVAMFGGGRRLVIVDEADAFVTKHRAALEDYLAKPRKTGVLVLCVASFPSNTRLFKGVDALGGAVDCSTPAEGAILKWLASWGKSRHKIQLERGAADSLLEIIGPQLGRLDQELAKLAASVGPGGKVDTPLVESLVGGWRARQVWDMLDAALAGDAAEAIGQLEKLLLSGEEPIGLLAQMAASLRRLAAAARQFDLVEASGQRLALRDVLIGVGVKPFVVAKTEGQLKQVGRVRALQLYDTLLEADLALKGASSQKQRARFVLERLIARLSKQADPRTNVASAAR